MHRVERLNASFSMSCQSRTVCTLLAEEAYQEVDAIRRGEERSCPIISSIDETVGLKRWWLLVMASARDAIPSHSSVFTDSWGFVRRLLVLGTRDCFMG